MSRRREKSLGDVGEFGFLRRLLPTLAQTRGVVVGPGDDCAVVQGRGPLLLTTDALVEGVHFERDWLTPEQIGAKAIEVNLSDIAAMGGSPRFVLLSVGVPPSFGRAALSRLHRGCESAARRAGAAIVGGNLSSADRLFVSVAVVGEAKRPVLRSGSKAGDLIFVTGHLGDAAAAVQLMKSGVGRLFAGSTRARATRGQKERRAYASVRRRFAAPRARLVSGRLLAQAGVVSSMIDVSDGLVQDLGHLCAASSCGAVIFEDNLPRSPAYDVLLGPDPTMALSGGEDYELLFTVPRTRLARLERLRRRLPDLVRFVGEMVARPRGVRIRDVRGRLRRIDGGGFQHFRPA